MACRLEEALSRNSIDSENAPDVSLAVPYWEKRPSPYAAQVGSRFGILSADRTSRCYRHAKMLQVQSGNGL